MLHAFSGHNKAEDSAIARQQHAFRCAALLLSAALACLLACTVALALPVQALAADSDLQVGQIQMQGEEDAGQLQSQSVASGDVLAAYRLYGDVLKEWRARIQYERTHTADFPPKASWPYTSGHWYGAGLPPQRTDLVYTLISLDENQPPFLIVADATRDYRIWGIYGYDASYNGGTLAYETYSMRQTVYLAQGRLIRSSFYSPAMSDGPHIDAFVGRFSGYSTYYGDRIIKYANVSRNEGSVRDASVNAWYDANGNVIESGASYDDMEARFNAAYPIDKGIIWKSVSSGLSQEPFNSQISWMSGSGSKAKKSAPTSWKRLHGNTALDTMVSIVREDFYTTGGTVVIATLDGYWDALAASGLAGLAEAPVLMTNGSALSSQTRNELQRLAPSRVFVCGGTAAVSDAVCSQIQEACGVAPRRIAGVNAVETAIQINKESPSATGKSWSNEAFLCTSNGYWDALAAAPLAYALHMPIFLTDADGTLSASTLQAIRDGGFTKVHIAGGYAAVSPSVEAVLGSLAGERFGGETAIETSQLIANFGLSRGMSANCVGVATTSGYWDALAGAALCGKKKSVLVLVADISSPSIEGFVGANSAAELFAYVFGGSAAVGNDVYGRLESVTVSY